MPVLLFLSVMMSNSYCFPSPVMMFRDDYQWSVDWVFTAGASETRRGQVTVSQACSFNQLRPTTGKPHTISDDDVMIIHVMLFQSCDDVFHDEGPWRRLFLPPTCHHVSGRHFGSRLITTPRGCFYLFKPLGQSISASLASASSGSGFVRPHTGSGFYPLPPRRLSSSIFSQLYVTM